MTLLTYILTYDMERSPAWEVNQFSVSQEIPHILWSLNVHYCIHMCPPPAPIPSSRSEAFCMNISEQDTFLQWVVSTSPSPQAGGPPPVGCPRLLIQYIRSYPPYWRPFLHPQPEDAPCRGDRDPLIMELKDSLSDGFYWLKSDFLVNILPNVSSLLQNKRPEGSDSYIQELCLKMSYLISERKLHQTVLLCSY